jgi:hypothetical protein
MTKAASEPARLEAMTPEARRLLGVSTIAVEPLPFRVGRGELRKAALMGGVRKKLEAVFRAADVDDAAPTDQRLELPEKSDRRFVSKDHFEIVRTKRGWELVDLGSSLGTIVDGELVGGKRQGGRAPLQDGSVIIVGSHHSGFVFKFRCG